MSFPAYSGLYPVCEKCGSKGAETNYRVHSRCLHNIEDAVLILDSRIEETERLHRECSTCGFMWDEAVVSGSNIRS